VRLLLHWILSALAVWIVANLGIGITVSGPKAALIAAAVIGLINATIGLLLKILTFPLTIVTLGLFWFCDQRADARTGGKPGARVPGARFSCRVYRRHPVEHRQFDIAMAGHAEPQKQLGLFLGPRMQFGEDPLHLFLGRIQRAGVINHEIGRFDFLFVRNLRRHAASYLSTGSVFRNSKAASETQNALLRMAGHDDQTVKTAGHSGFEDQGSFDDDDGVRIASANFLHPLLFMRDHCRMDNLVEFLNARRRSAGSAERGCGQPGTVDASVGVQDLAAETAHDVLINLAARLHESMRNGIGLNQPRPAFDKHLSNDRFAARDAAGEAEP
jgi:hypothetical protein